ncbi:hypothetical protein C8A05DRAFT_17662 [Staphylotrichum tortipilum]|uniref:Uncharacterized protein n=1 Tax=Staphylotrichum tortipilum TaxID=2831512 RepID=A0AAN6MH11_9PEZI|nr:hypothetical protein C8A05DRAFT_17662 [Staphylotrichum longicolle]
MPPPAPPDLILAYRRLLRAGLRAVQFAKPARMILTAKLRAGFRDPRGVFDVEAVRRTVWFLNSAAGRRGIEHRILKNLCRVEWERRQGATWKVRLRGERVREERGRVLTGCVKRDPNIIQGTEYEHYERTIDMLNKTFRLCLR